MGVAPGSDTGGSQDVGTGMPLAVHQEVMGFGQARQASQGVGVQYNFFGDLGPVAEPGVSIAAPAGNWISVYRCVAAMSCWPH